MKSNSPVGRAPLSGTDKLWQDLAAMDKGDVCRRSLAVSEDDTYHIVFMGGKYILNPALRTVIAPEKHPLVSGEMELLLLAYLVGANEINLAGKWISCKEIPGGSQFYQGPHKMPLEPLAAKYGTDPEGFLKRAKAAGGTVLVFGDASTAFNSLPRIPVAFVLWTEDDEFPPEVTVMFDETIVKHLPVDVVLALVGSTVKFLV